MFWVRERTFSLETEKVMLFTLIQGDVRDVTFTKGWWWWYTLENCEINSSYSTATTNDRTYIAAVCIIALEHLRQRQEEAQAMKHYMQKTKQSKAKQIQ